MKGANTNQILVAVQITFVEIISTRGMWATATITRSMQSPFHSEKVASNIPPHRELQPSYCGTKSFEHYRNWILPKTSNFSSSSHIPRGITLGTVNASLALE